MSESALRPGSIVAAAVMIGGLIVVLFPQHGVTVVQVVVVTAAAAVGLFALAVTVPEWSAVRWLMSPFNRTGRAEPERRAPHELERIRWRLSRRRQRIRDGTPLPPEVLRLLQRLVRVALERKGLDPNREAHLETIRRRVTPLTWAVLSSEPMGWKHWYQTLWGNERQVAEVVHGVLDDLDHLTAGTTDDDTAVPSN